MTLADTGERRILRHNCDTTDRGVPRRDWEGEQASARLRNGNAKLGDLRYLVGG
jgi:hypothetical protein